MKTTATFDTGRAKSLSTIIWIGPFAVFSAIGVSLVGVDIIRDGLRQPWYSQVIGMSLLLPMFIGLSTIFLRGVRRNLIQIDSDRITVLHQGFFKSRQIEVVRADAEEFYVRSTDIVFDVLLKKKSGTSVPVIQSLTTKRFDECVVALSRFAPFAQPLQMNQGEQAVDGNPH